jgi:hypothetical protein
MCSTPTRGPKASSPCERNSRANSAAVSLSADGKYSHASLMPHTIPAGDGRGQSERKAQQKESATVAPADAIQDGGRQENYCIQSVVRAGNQRSCEATNA